LIGQELADHASSRSAEGRADGNFALSTSGPVQKKIRDVYARDEEHKRDRSEKRPEHWADVANEVIPQRSQDDSSCRVLRRVLPEEVFRDLVHFPVRLIRGYGVLEANNGTEVTAVAAGIGGRDAS
jgi:hypothetical protein